MFCMFTSYSHKTCNFLSVHSHAIKACNPFQPSFKLTEMSTSITSKIWNPNTYSSAKKVVHFLQIILCDMNSGK